MNIRIGLKVLVIMSGLVASIAAALHQHVRAAPQNEVTIDHLPAIPMRDAMTLYANVYRPVKEGTYPEAKPAAGRRDEQQLSAAYPSHVLLLVIP